MDADTRRELDIMWKHGIEKTSQEIRDMREEVRRELKTITSNISGTRKLVITAILTGVPAWVGLYLSYTKK